MTCRPGRLQITEIPIPIPSFQGHEETPIEFAIANQGHVFGHIFVQFVPQVSYQRRLTGIIALRYDLVAHQWLDPLTYSVPPDRMRQLPPASQLTTFQRQTDVLLIWDRFNKPTVGVRFEVGSGVWTPANADDDADNVQWRDGLARSLSHPPNPEPSTGVSIELDADDPRLITVSDSGGVLGTVHFPSEPGTYVGMFTDTQTALFWAQSSEHQDDEFPFEYQVHSYLVDVYTGQTCRASETGDGNSSVYRLGPQFLFIEGIYSEEGRSNCPSGAPCMPPEPSHLRGAAGMLIDDAG